MTLLVVSMAAIARAAAPPAPIPLDGEWSFALDEADAGLHQNWQSSPTFPDTIPVPGVSIGAAGFGQPTAQKHHEYTGISWFAKNATLPAGWLPAEKELLAGPGAVALTCGGVKNSATFWADGVWLGNHSGYMDGFEIDMRPWLLHWRRQAAAKAPAVLAAAVRLTVRLDGTHCYANNSNTTSCGCGGVCFSSVNSGAWSGIWGHVALVRRTPLTLDQLTVKTLSLPGVDGGTDGAASIEVSAQLGNGQQTLADYIKLAAQTSGGDDDLQVSVVISEHGSGKVALRHTVPLRDALQQPTLHSGGQPEKPVLKLVLPVAAPKLWSPLSPSLYHANISLSGGGGGSTHARFGLRTLVIDGQYFILNGKRHFLVGTGDDFGYVGEAPPQDTAVLKSRLGAMKEYGFDFVRLHSHFEAKSYFDVADELGFFISPALQQGSCHEQLLRTWKFWLNELRNSPSVMDMDMANEAYGTPVPPNNWNGGHGQLGGWPGQYFEWHDEFYKVAKQMRPELHVLMTDGCCWSAGQRNKAKAQELVDGPDICPEPLANGTCGWATNDFMCPSFGIQTPMVYTDMYADNQCGTAEYAEHGSCGPPPKPLVSHEMGNFGTFPDIATIAAAMKPTNMRTDSRESVLAAYEVWGYTAPVLAHWVDISKSHAYFCWKATVEYLRRSPSITGHSWWLFQDILGASNGLVDYMFQAKGGALSPANIKKIVDPVVLVLSTGILWKENEQSAVYASGETLKSTLLASNYWPSNLTDCMVTWSATLVPDGAGETDGAAAAAAAPFAHGSRKVAAIAQGAVVELTSLEQIVMPTVTEPAQFNLSASLRCSAAGSTGFQPRANDWQAWVYPPVKPLLQLPVTAKKVVGEIFVSPSILRKVQAVAPGAKPLPSAAQFTRRPFANDLYVASQQDMVGAIAKSWDQVLAAVDAGSTLLLPEFPECSERQCPTAPFASLVQSPLLFHSPWWTNDDVTPTALYVPLDDAAARTAPVDDDASAAAGDEAARGETPSLAVPAGIRAMATAADGRVDNAWFGGFGPVPSACVQPPSPPPVPRDKWPCPKAFPFPAASALSYICYTNASYANVTSGPCGSWCALCGGGVGCGPDGTHACLEPGGNPAGGPGWNTHCPAKALPGPHMRAGAAFKPSNNSLSFKQWLESQGGTMWLGAVYSSNFKSPSVGSTSGSPLGGSIFAVPRGNGRIIVSGVAMDMTECHRAPEEPHQLFDDTLLRALLEAGATPQ